MNITAEMFRAAVGYAPEQDDLERCNCPKAGQMGHFYCGWDKARNMPNFVPDPPKKAAAVEAASIFSPGEVIK